MSNRILYLLMFLFLTFLIYTILPMKNRSPPIESYGIKLRSFIESAMYTQLLQYDIRVSSLYE